MNSMGTRPAPAPCKELDPLVFRPRDVARAQSTIVLVEPVSRTKESGRDPLRRVGTKIIPLFQRKANVDFPLPAVKVTSGSCPMLATRQQRGQPRAPSSTKRVSRGEIWCSPCDSPVYRVLDFQRNGNVS